MLGDHNASIGTTADPLLILLVPGCADMDGKDVQKRHGWELQADKTFSGAAPMYKSQDSKIRIRRRNFMVVGSTLFPSGCC